MKAEEFRKEWQKTRIKNFETFSEIEEFAEAYAEQENQALQKQVDKAESKLICNKHNYHLTYDSNLEDYFCYKCEAN